MSLEGKDKSEIYNVTEISARHRYDEVELTIMDAILMSQTV